MIQVLLRELGSDLQEQDPRIRARRSKHNKNGPQPIDRFSNGEAGADDGGDNSVHCDRRHDDPRNEKPARKKRKTAAEKMQDQMRQQMEEMLAEQTARFQAFAQALVSQTPAATQMAMPSSQRPAPAPPLTPPPIPGSQRGGLAGLTSQRPQQGELTIEFYRPPAPR